MLIANGMPSSVKENIAGLGIRMLVAEVSDVATCPEPKTLDDDTVTDWSEYASVSTPIVNATGKNFEEVYATLKTGELKVTYEGEIDSKSPTVSLEFFMKGVTARELGFAKWIANRNLIVLIEKDCGSWFKMGCKCRPVNAENIETTTGKQPGDMSGTTFTFTTNSHLVAYESDAEALLTAGV